MIRRRLIALTAAVITGAGLFAMAYPALATTTAAQPPGAPDSLALDDSQLQNPGMAAAMSRDLNLTPAQTQARLTMESWARRTAPKLRSAVGTTFAGAWLTSGAETLVVAVTDPAMATRVKDAGAQPKVVPRSAAQLASVKSALDRAAPGESSIRGLFTDVASNTVVVLAKPGALTQAEQFVATSGVDSSAVRVVTAPAAFRPLFDVRGGDPYLINGAARCSVGFSVTGGFVTAGHCGQAGATTVGFNNVAQGTFKGSTFPGNGDFALVQVNNQWTPQPLVDRQPNVSPGKGATVSVAGSQEAPVGSSVCRSGSTTGWHCGVIQSLNATINLIEGTVTGLTQTNVCAEAGDSGGSYISGNQAQGVTSSGSGDCKDGGTTFFQPVNEILAAFKVKLVTTNAGGGGASAAPSVAPSVAPSASGGAGAGGGQPPQDVAPGVNCATSQAIFKGSLSGVGARQTQPNGAFYQTTKTGIQLGCLSAPADANFSLTLQRWNGQRFATVASAPAGTGNKTLAVRAPAGAYRWQVTSVQGSGNYTLGLTAT
jgi:streptogrisin C